MSSVDDKTHTLVNKIPSTYAKSIFCEDVVKNYMFTLKEDFAIAPIDKAANNVVFICKHFYVLTIITEVNLDCHLSDQDGNYIYKLHL